MGKPTLCVVMCNFNHGHYISEALEAILAQSFRPLEVIVIDDGSTDNSVAVIEQFVKRDPIVRLLRNARNMGVVISANRGLEHAAGEYVYYAAADDRVLPGFFEKSMSLLSQYPQAGLCLGGAYFVDEAGRLIYEGPIFKPGSGFITPEVFAIELTNGRYDLLFGSSIIYRRLALLEVGGFPAELHTLIDIFVDQAIALKYGACYIHKPLSVARFTQRNYSQSIKSWDTIAEMRSNYLRMMKSSPNGAIFPPAYIAFCQREAVYAQQRAALGRLQKQQEEFLAEMRCSISRLALLDRVILKGFELWMRSQRLVVRAYLSRHRVAWHFIVGKMRRINMRRINRKLYCLRTVVESLRR